MAGKKILIYSKTFQELLEPHYSNLRTAGYEIIAENKWIDSYLDPEDLQKYLPEVDAVISGGGFLLNEKHLAIARRLKVISLACSGYESLDMPLLTKSGIVVTNTPIPEMAVPVADLTFGLILSLAREIPRYDRIIKSGQYERGFGQMVWGKTLGVIGLGQIGKEVAKRGRGFSMEVLAYDIYKNDTFSEQWSIKSVELVELLRRSDYISIHLRLDDKTRNMIGERELSLMKPSSYLINTSRLQIVDNNALYSLLESGKIAGAALDFGGDKGEYPPGLFMLDNVIITPHLGNRCRETSHAIQECAVQNILDVFNEKIPKYVVNPEVYKVIGFPEEYKNIGGI